MDFKEYLYLHEKVSGLPDNFDEIVNNVMDIIVDSMKKKSSTFVELPVYQYHYGEGGRIPIFIELRTNGFSSGSSMFKTNPFNIEAHIQFGTIDLNFYYNEDNPPLDRIEEIKNKVFFSLAHEVAHATSVEKKDLDPEEWREYPKNKINSTMYSRFPAEWEPNVTALVAGYNRLSQKEKDNITLSELIHKFAPDLLVSYGKYSTKWRNLLMKRLSREGVLIRNW